MMEYIFFPYEGIGELKFNQKRETVRGVMSFKMTSFFKTPNSVSETDAYEDLGLHIYYDKNNLVEAFEIFPSSQLKVTYNGHIIVGTNFIETLNWLNNEDKMLKIQNDGLDAMTLGLSLWVPDGTSKSNSLVKSTLFFREGYWN